MPRKFPLRSWRISTIWLSLWKMVGFYVLVPKIPRTLAPTLACSMWQLQLQGCNRHTYSVKCEYIRIFEEVIWGAKGGDCSGSLYPARTV
jgi:hypothetical protein